MEEFHKFIDLMKEHPTRTAALVFGLTGGVVSAYCYHQQVNPLLKFMIGYIIIKSGKVIGEIGDDAMKESKKFEQFTHLNENWHRMQAEKHAFRLRLLSITGRVLYPASSLFVGFGVGYTLGTTCSLLMLMKDGV